MADFPYSKFQVFRARFFGANFSPLRAERKTAPLRSV